MKAKELKKVLTIEQIVQLMEHLGADFLSGRNPNEIQFRTICHCGDSHKLYFYKDTKEFHCYSNCGQMDIINIVQNVQKVQVPEAIGYICRFFGISSGYMKEGFSDEFIGDDWDIFEMYNIESKAVDVSREFKVLDPEILNRFRRMYHPSFYEDGITLETLYKFGIRYDILNRRIIIPHWDEENNLIAIRCRNLREELVDEGMKYMPITLEGKLLSAHTTKYFYGLNFNQDNIKRSKKVILVESEKAVMQLESILNDNIALALSSSSLSAIQVELLIKLGVQEVIVALDKEYEEYGSKEEKLYAMKIRKGILNKLTTYFNVSVIWDKEGLIGYKESPSDRGSEVFWKLMNTRLRIN